MTLFLWPDYIKSQEIAGCCNLQLLVTYLWCLHMKNICDLLCNLAPTSCKKLQYFIRIPGYCGGSHYNGGRRRLCSNVNNIDLTREEEKTRKTNMLGEQWVVSYSKLGAYHSLLTCHRNATDQTRLEAVGFCIYTPFILYCRCVSNPQSFQSACFLLQMSTQTLTTKRFPYPF